MNDYIDSFKLSGDVLIDGQNIYEKNILVDELKKCRMVFKT